MGDIGIKYIDRYNRIVRLIRHAPLNCTEIAERTGCTAKTAQRYINAMRRDGYIVEYIAKCRGYKIIGRK